jgi:hypothetical protein
MLRITKKTNGHVVFKVSGQLTKENVSEMEALIAAEAKGKRIVLLAKEKQSGDLLIVNHHAAELAKASADATVDRHLQEGRSLS